MQDSLCAPSVLISILDTQHTRKLMLKTINLIIGALLAILDVVDVRLITVRFVMHSKNRGTVAGAVGFTCDFYFFAR